MQQDIIPAEPNIFTVSQISNNIKSTIEDVFGYIKVKGEVSGFKIAPSGHAYFNLKDNNSILSAVCWRTNVARTKIRPEDGMEIICAGRLTTYSGQSKYQIIVSSIETSGVGALMALLEKRKKQLAAEGLFDPGKKKHLPFIPKIIGVITSPTGAVIQDILHRIEERFPTHILLWPVLVQGSEAAGQIEHAINGFNNLTSKKPDVIIVARGGGSIEDLWAFNEENVVRATANSHIPIISAIGHETDTTLIDYAADLRAPTPSAAAEKSVPVRDAIFEHLLNLNARKTSAIHRVIKEKQLLLDSANRSLISPQRKLQEWIQSLDNICIRLQNTMPRIFERKQEQLSYIVKLLDSNHYKKILQRGFTLVRDHESNLIKSAKSLEKGQNLTIEFNDGNKEVITK